MSLTSFSPKGPLAPVGSIREWLNNLWMCVCARAYNLTIEAFIVIHRLLKCLWKQLWFMCIPKPMQSIYFYLYVPYISKTHIFVMMMCSTKLCIPIITIGTNNWILSAELFNWVCDNVISNVQCFTIIQMNFQKLDWGSTSCMHSNHNCNKWIFYLKHLITLM